MQISRITNNYQNFKGWETNLNSVKDLAETINKLPYKERTEALRIFIELDKHTPNHDLFVSKEALGKFKFTASLYGLESITKKQGIFKNRDLLSTLRSFRNEVMSAENNIGGDIDFVSAYKDSNTLF